MVDALEQARARAGELLAPLSGPTAAGSDPRQDARGRWLGDAMLVEPIVRREWPAIAEASASLLREVGKDLRAASFWATAAYELSGLSGLAEGFALLAGLLREHWDDMWPRRPRARENALANLYEHLAIRLPAFDPGEDDPRIVAESLAVCRTLLDDLHAAATERFAPPPIPRQARAELNRLSRSHAPPEESGSGDPPTGEHDTRDEPAPPASADSPIPGDAATASDGLANDDPANEGPASDDPTHTGRGGTSATETPPPTTTKTSRRPPIAEPRAARSAPRLPAVATPDDDDDGALDRFIAGLSQTLRKAATSLRRRSAADPLAYRLARVGSWLRAVSPASADGTTELVGLAPGDRRKYEAMLGSERWEQLLDAAESALSRPAARFHLDLQRYVLTALGRLGHDAARQAVLAELAALLTRIPELPQLLDRGDVPLADEATRRLLETLLVPSTTNIQRAALIPAGAGTTGASTAKPVADANRSVTDRRPPPPSRPAPAVAPPVALAPAPSTRSVAPRSTPTGSAPTSPLATTKGLVTLGEAVAAAREGCERGEHHASIAALQTEIDQLGGPRERFRGRLELARLCLESDLRPVASALFTNLDDEARARGLDGWEPALAAAALTGRLESLPPDATAELRHGLFTRLCAVDPSAAALLSLPS